MRARPRRPHLRRRDRGPALAAAHRRAGRRGDGRGVRRPRPRGGRGARRGGRRWARPTSPSSATSPGTAYPCTWRRPTARRRLAHVLPPTCQRRRCGQGDMTPVQVGSIQAVAVSGGTRPTPRRSPADGVVRRHAARRPVRLAKRTSNLFRPRAADAPGTRRVRPRGVIASTRGAAPPTCRACAPTRTSSTRPCRTGSCRWSCRSCAPSRSAARSPGSASSRPRSATGCRTSRCSRWTCSPAPARSSPPARRRAVRRVPELLRHAGLRHPAADRAGAGAGVRRAAARPLRRPRRARRPSTGSSRPAGRRRAGGRIDGVVFGPGEAYLMLARFTDAARTATSDYTGKEIYYRSLQRARAPTGSPRTTTCGAGTPTGSGARARSARSTRWCGGCGRGAGGAATSTTASSGWRTATASSPARPAAGRPARERVVQDVEMPVDRLADFLAGSTPRSGCRRCGCARCGSDAASWPSYPLAPGRDLRQRRLLGHRADRAGRARRRRQPRHRGQGDGARRPQVALLRRLLRPRDVRPALRRQHLRPQRPQGRPTPTTG